MRQYAGFASAEETNERFRHLLAAGQTGLSVAFDLPTQLGLDSDDPLAAGEVGRTGVAIDSLDDMLRLFDGIPLGGVSTSMTINAPAAVLLLLYELAGAEHGVRAGRAARHGAERRAQGVRRARQLHLPAAPVHAPDRRRLPLLQRAPAALQHDLDLGLPHPRGRLERRAGARLHARQRHRLRRGGAGGRPLGRRLRAAPVVLLQRAQRRLRRGRQVPRRAPDLGHADARALRRARRALARAALPRADGRLDADGAGAADERRAGGAAGASPRPPAAASRCTRTATTRRSRCRPSAPRRSRCAPSRCCCTSRAWRPCPIRSAARSTSRG